MTTSLERLAVASAVLWALGAALTPWTGLWLAVGGTALALGVACVSVAWPRLRPLLVPSARHVAVGLASGAIQLGATYGLYPVFRQRWAFVGAGVAPLYATFRSVPFALATLLVLPIVIASEEIVWRGVVLEALRERMGTAMPAALACSLLYAASHATAGSLVLTLAALLCGAFWCALRVGTGSLVPGVVAHVVWDLVVLCVWPLDRGL